jgi:hypothetical protein
MNDRERFLNCMHFKPVDRIPRWEWGFRPDTTERWHREGLTSNVPDGVGWTEFLHLDEGGGYAGGSMARKVGVSVDLMPDFEGDVLEESERIITRRNKWGAIVKSSKVGESIPQYVSFPLRTREDFQTYRSRWDPANSARYPQDWGTRKAAWKRRTYPISIYAYGWYGLLRELMGVEGLSVALHEDESLIDSVCEFWGDFLIQVFDRALKEADVDYVLFWEDLAFKTGPLLSPRHFRRFFLPHYKRVIEQFRRHGLKLFMVDSDGNIESILPLWIEAGINILAPFEVSAGMDVRRVERDYGKDLSMVGGIDKMEIAKGRKAIEAEVSSRVGPLLGRGGYIPTLDHSPIPEISFQDYLYYREFLVKACEGKA